MDLLALPTDVHRIIHSFRETRITPYVEFRWFYYRTDSDCGPLQWIAETVTTYGIYPRYTILSRDKQIEVGLFFMIAHWKWE